MANDVVVRKWKQWFNLLDANKDGVLCGRDTAAVSEKFTNLHHLHGEEKTKLCNDISKWFDDFLFQGRTDRITETDFVDRLTKQYENTDTFREMMVKLADVYYQITDMSKDGQMSEEHFIINAKAVGHENEAHIKAVFKQCDPVDGHVQLQRLKDEWVWFFTSNNPQPVSHGVEPGVDM